MEAKPDKGTEDRKPHLGGSQENRQRPQKVEDDSRGPMLHMERRGLTQDLATSIMIELQRLTAD
jgi:hypothetical protein